MDLQHILNSRNAGSWALRISQVLPPALGILLSRWIADRVAVNRRLPLIRAFRSNRWVISGGRLAGADLDQAARATMRHLARSYFTLFHYIDNPPALQNLVNFSPALEELIARSHEKKRGVVVAGLHLSNFDLALQASAWRGLRGVTITLPEDTENRAAVEWQNRFRRRTGIQVLTASMPNMREAIRRLQAGELVLTGMDRPVRSAKYYPLFFGRPAHVPIHHIHLALAARVPVLVFTSLQRSDGIYQILSSPEIELKSNRDRRVELVSNAERVLEVAESFIRQAPEQWCVTLPAWPETLEEISDLKV